MKLKPLCLCLLSLSSAPAFAVVCTDPTGNFLHLEEMAKDAAIWIEEKGLYMAQMAQEKAAALYEQMRAEYNASAEISATTTSISTTQNAASEERYASSPSVCGTLSRAKGVMESLTSSCNNPVTRAVFENNQSQITDCGLGGSGLNCDRVASRRKEISGELSRAVRERNGKNLTLLLDGSKLVGLGDTPMYPEDKAQHDLALSLLLGVEDPTDMPRRADGQMMDANIPSQARTMNQWARKHVIRSIPNGAISRVKRLYEPMPDGSMSAMDRLEEQVNYFNSEQFIKLLSNTNNKDNLPSNWAELSPEQKHDWNQNADIDEKIVSSEQVVRMLGEMEALSLRLGFLTLEAQLSTNTLAAMQLKVMSE
ncbi:TPA: hypothetical protein I7142_18330 [Vibrio vulnificus]|uniref:hypothetical protein n=1 Tax=Vibrio TaxID=662 RepID=UPI0004DF7A88|nr:hypothetical protein [Vibrio parahaemolyticus]EGQ9239490.1 hypothetical protein [Vibrio vulnificus]EHD1698132.1 hypothetical protein [Vibrio vulnificus]EKZ9225861.1 hypothetical protein [Vibrio vulnificus]ELC9582703.1 hypothetical protein [Vibrio vulnificus]MCU8149760.1 hypothetical protein [Vibrio vulnificus]